MSEVKHKPESPLPWIFNERAKDWEGDPSYEDAAYIAHVANAYPKLVEALRQMSDVHGRAVESIGRATLRELGEDA